MMLFRRCICEAGLSYRHALFLDSSILLLIALLFLARVNDMNPFVVAEALCQEQGAREKIDEIQNTYKSESMAEWHVFLVGTNNYSKNTGPLQAAENDVDELAEIFSSLGVKDENLIVLKSSNIDPSSQTHERPIKRKYEQFIEGLTSSSIAFVYLVGHGFTDANDGRAYYAAQDFEEDYPDEARISIDDMMKQLSTSKARFKWLCVDACRNEFVPVKRRALGRSRSLSISQAPEGVVLTQSCSKGQFSLEFFEDDAPFQNGFFSRAFCDAISGRSPEADKDQDGVVTLGELRNYLESQVPKYARLYGGGKMQNPVFTMMNDTEFAKIADFKLFEDMPIFGHHPQEYRRGQELRREAEALEKEEKYAEALEKIKESYSILPDVPEIESIKDRIEKLFHEHDNGTKALEAYKNSERALDAKNYTDALRYIDQAIQLDPKNEAYAIYRKLIEERQKNSTKPTIPTQVSPPVPTPTPMPEPVSNFGTNPNVTTSLPTGRRKAGDVITIAIRGVQVRFRWCPAGTFIMGSPEYEEGRDNDETQHDVTLTRGFWLAETETTQELWEAVMGDNPSEFKGDYLPVENVSWYDCQEFIDKIQRYAPSGLKFQLPSEAHWEYACRAGTTGSYNVSGESLDSLSWYQDNSGDRTYPVGRKIPNAWGLYDMHGNVWEWCSDRYGTYPSGSVTDPRGVDDGSYRVYRGGSCNSSPTLCHSAKRSGYRPESYVMGQGFRLELDASSGIREDVDNTSPSRNFADETVDRVKPVPIADASAGEVMTVSIAGVNVRFRWCPAGTFIMGSPEYEDGRFDSETQHNVTLTRGFWLAETETTQELWEAVMSDNPSEFKGANLPVENVSWYDCQEFIDKIQRYAPSGLNFQLPSEAHWEYACRAGTTGSYNVSGASLDSLAWYGDNSDYRTHPVGRKTPNAWGLYDMHGNVSEWCSDWLDDYPSGSVTDPRGAGDGSHRVPRGGAWAHSPRYCRSAYRGWGSPGYRVDRYGFRLELDASSGIR